MCVARICVPVVSMTCTWSPEDSLQVSGVGCLLPASGYQGLNSDHQVWQQSTFTSWVNSSPILDFLREGCGIWTQLLMHVWRELVTKPSPQSYWNLFTNVFSLLRFVSFFKTSHFWDLKHLTTVYVGTQVDFVWLLHRALYGGLVGLEFA